MKAELKQSWNPFDILKLMYIRLCSFKDVLFLVQRMEPASSTSFEIPAVFVCKLAGKKCGNFKTA